uniref:unspecific monooxygenase n=1 Tax=Falco tinnunculus TaxID=100819 RepID=A0A8C4V3H9_FALTI
MQKIVQEPYKTYNKVRAYITNSLTDQCLGKKVVANIVTIGRERRPRLSDRGTLPYTEAFILEMFRHSSFLPFTIPHSRTRDIVLNSYYSPKGCCVLVHQWEVNHLPTHPRRCWFPVWGKGSAVTRWQVFPLLSTLLQQLELSVCDGKKVDMTSLYGLSPGSTQDGFSCCSGYSLQKNERDPSNELGWSKAPLEGPACWRTSATFSLLYHGH